MRQRILDYYRENKANLHREGRFWLLVFVWVGLHVYSLRGGWRAALNENELQNFATSTEKKLTEFENRISFWSNHAQLISQYTNSLSPLDLQRQSLSWSALFENHPEWLATHAVTRRHGYEPSVATTLLSSKLAKLRGADRDAPLPWGHEVQANALQLIAGLKDDQLRSLSFVRSLAPGAQWIQMAIKTRSPAGWSTWVVHTFSEEMFPNLQKEKPEAEVALYNKDTKKFIFSKNFPTLKIESSELSSFINSRKTESGSEDTRFAMSKKNLWVAWRKPPSGQFVLIQILPHQMLPLSQLTSEPSPVMEWVLSLIWLIISVGILHWTFRKKLWRLRIKKSADEDQASKAMDTADLSAQKPSEKLNKQETEREFCRHLLTDVGPMGEIKLSGKAIAKIKATPSALYKGSWWILDNIDSNRIFLAIGDASGQGLAAGASAYSIRFVFEKALKNRKFKDNSESELLRFYNLAALSSEGILLGSTHNAIFIAIIELEKQKMAFINAGYPGPMLNLSQRKRVLLAPQTDPIGLTNNEQPFPRWVNLTEQSELNFCNVGVRNMDLAELEDTELVTIQIYPYGASEERMDEGMNDEDDAA